MADNSRQGTLGERAVAALRSGLGVGIGAAVAALLVSIDPQNPILGALITGGVVGGAGALIQFAAGTYQAGKGQRR